MFAQLFLGFFFIVKGIVEHFSRKPNLFLSEAAIQSISTAELSSYLNKVGKTHIALGVFIASMGQIEYRYNPELWVFITVYIILGLAFIAVIASLNKRYSGSFMLGL